MHLAVYKQLIGLSSSSSRIALKKKSDKWLLFYARLMLRYHRAHKYKMIESMADSRYKERFVKRSKIHKSPAELIKPWLKLASSSTTKTKMTNMMDSCKLKSGDKVQFKLIYNNFQRCETFYGARSCTVELQTYLTDNTFFSCWVSGSYCKFRNCPKEKILVRGSSYEYNWACRGETFTIFADQKTINHKTVVNVRYSIMRGRGFWVSSGDTMGTNAKTRNCPGKYFTKIKSGCDMENLKILEWDTSTSKGIYDGSFVEIGDNKEEFVYELYIYGSESSKKGHISAPL